MKTTILSALLCLAVWNAQASPSFGQISDAQRVQKRQSKPGGAICIRINTYDKDTCIFILTPKAPGGRVPDVLGAAPRKQEQKINGPTLPGVKRVKMRYGPCV